MSKRVEHSRVEIMGMRCCWGRVFGFVIGFCFLLRIASAQQGYIHLMANGAVKPVYGPDLFDCFSTVLDTRARIKLDSRYMAQLWFAVGQDRPESSLRPLDVSTVPFVRNGIFLKTGQLPIPGSYAGQWVTMQLRAWRWDAATPYWNETLFQEHGVEYGKSERFSVTAGGDASGIDSMGPLLNLVGAIPSFGVSCVRSQLLLSEMDGDGDGIPDGAETGRDGRYLMVFGQYTFAQAEADAVRRGGHLASFSSLEEWSNLGMAMRERWLTNVQLWLGGVYEPTNRSWAWTDEERTTFPLWNEFYPQERSGLILQASSLPQTLGFRADIEVLGGYLMEFGEWSSPLLVDTDGDGSWDRTEVLNGTSPNDPASVPTLQIQARKRTELVVLLKKNQRYQVEYRVGSEWRLFGAATLGDGEEQNLFLDAGAEQENVQWRVRLIDRN